MKKLITTAALLGIGAAASFGADVSFTLTGNSGATITNNTDINGGRATFESITVDGTTLSSGGVLDGSLYSWTISFSTAISNSESWNNNTNVIFSTSGGSNGSGSGILATQSNGSISYYLVDEVYSTESESHVASGSALTVDSGSTITLSWDAVNSTLTLASGDETSLVLTESSAVSLTVGVSGSGTGGIDSDTPSGSVFWTNGGQNNISGITLVAEKTVPEPSMFGLLAGLGAIGLVAARRRRNRKA
ncbi:MAG: PEP-CTERM sorting domain-containing protein [Opitutae bacterium]|nr:PEP-CTERM sorting domain-containing protein [Opitutae bacterium]